MSRDQFALYDFSSLLRLTYLLHGACTDAVYRGSTLLHAIVILDHACAYEIRVIRGIIVKQWEHLRKRSQSR